MEYFIRLDLLRTAGRRYSDSAKSAGLTYWGPAARFACYISERSLFISLSLSLSPSHSSRIMRSAICTPPEITFRLVDITPGLPHSSVAFRALPPTKRLLWRRPGLNAGARYFSS